MHPLALHGAMFFFRRDPSKYNQYVCVCGTLFSSFGSLQVHVQGSTRDKKPQVPCAVSTAKAFDIARTKDIVDDNKRSISYKPLAPKLRMPNHKDDQHIVDIEEEPNNSVDNEIERNNKREADDEVQLKSVLRANDLALKDAINALKKARSDIKKRLKTT
ncbi:hypothetical protein BGX30_005154 [Mortierella sp. GBA39]|nr:hypothetical protein BGX30_005154 [Mortierella sp. GBA39]